MEFKTTTIDAANGMNFIATWQLEQMPGSTQMHIAASPNWERQVYPDGYRNKLWREVAA